MPRRLDHDQRRRDIMRAASKLLIAQDATFASIAAEMGGSTWTGPLPLEVVSLAGSAW